MKKFYVAQYAENEFLFIGNIPACLRDECGNSQTYASEQDARDAAFWNGYPFVEYAALVSKYGASH